MKKVTNCDIGGGGSKAWHFHGDVIFEWALSEIGKRYECFYQKDRFHVRPATLNICSACLLHQISNAKMH